MFNRILIKTLKKTISNLEKDLDLSKMQIRERDKLIQSYQEDNEILLENAEELRFENEDQEELIREIKRLVSCNTYNNEKAFLGKIKELVNDWQSNY